MVVIFLLGFVLDFIEITFVVVPIVGPVLLAMGLDPVWLGIMIAINLQTSFLTPPFGFALFYLRGVAPASVETCRYVPRCRAIYYYSAILNADAIAVAGAGNLVAFSYLQLISVYIRNSALWKTRRHQQES